MPIVCSICSKEKEETEFYIRSSGKPRSDCKMCFNARVKANKAKNIERERAYYRAYCKARYDENPEKYREKAKKQRASNPERQKEIWKRSNAKRRLAMTDAQKASEKARLAEYRSKNRELCKARSRASTKANPAKHAHNQRMRAMLKAKATPRWLTEEHKAEIFQKYALSAQLTKDTGIRYHVDHIYPLKGKICSGLHVPWNLQVIPATVNIQKSNKLPSDVEHLGVS